MKQYVYGISNERYQGALRECRGPEGVGFNKPVAAEEVRRNQVLKDIICLINLNLILSWFWSGC